MDAETGVDACGAVRQAGAVCVGQRPLGTNQENFKDKLETIESNSPTLLRPSRSLKTNRKACDQSHSH